jgi:putative serine protease PepD
MSIRDGVEPSRSPDSESHTQPLPRDPQDPSQTQQDPWPPSWGQAPPPAGPAPAAPAADGPGWTPPAAAQGPSWTQAKSPEAPPPQGPEAPTDQTRPAWGQGGEGGGGYPTVPGWGAPPAGGGSPSGRRPTRWLAAVVAGVVLLASGYGISQALDDDPAPAGAGIPVAAPAGSSGGAAVTSSGEEPAAAVAKALLPTVVEIRHGSGVGSGFVYDANGYIMTAAHVIDGVDQVEVRLFDGTELQGEVVGTDERNDVGVVKVDRTGLKAAPLGIGQNLQVGQLAVAIGSPFGLNETVTAGIISSTDRTLADGREVIQTDAPINPGNSGGVLADRQGRVIGINSAIRPGNNSNGNVGIGFAVPIDIAAKSAAAIVKGEQIQIGYLGVTPSLTTTGGRAGALIQEVAPDSPAAKAGIQPGDLVVTIDGKAVENYSELVVAIRNHQPGDKVTLGVVRGGSETTITATLTERPAG